MYVASKKKSTFVTIFSIYEMQMNGLGKERLIIDELPGPKILMCYDSDSKTLFVSDLFAGNIMKYSAKGLHSSFCKRFKSYFTNFNELYYYINRLNF